MVALLQQDGVFSFACFDVKSNVVLKHWECPFQGKSGGGGGGGGVSVSIPSQHECFHSVSVGAFDVVSSKVVFAGFDGRIQVVDLDSKDLEEAQTTPSPVHTNTALGHYGSVCGVLHLKGSTNVDGVTSFFSTYVGRPVVSTSQDFVLSIGVGNANSHLCNSFPNLILKDEFCLNAWMI